MENENTSKLMPTCLGTEMHVDPVCGSRVEEQQAAAQSEYLARKYYFCSVDCKHKFDQRPENYVIRSGQPQQNEPDIQA